MMNNEMLHISTPSILYKGSCILVRFNFFTNCLGLPIELLRKTNDFMYFCKNMFLKFYAVLHVLMVEFQVNMNFLIYIKNCKLYEKQSSFVIFYSIHILLKDRYFITKLLPHTKKHQQGNTSISLFITKKLYVFYIYIYIFIYIFIYMMYIEGN